VFACPQRFKPQIIPVAYQRCSCAGAIVIRRPAARLGQRPSLLRRVFPG
jgi:hypothetical protein